MFPQFTLSLHADITEIVEVFHHVRQQPTYSTQSILMGADVLATQRARTSATIIFAMLNRNNSVPARYGLTRKWPNSKCPQHPLHFPAINLPSPWQHFIRNTMIYISTFEIGRLSCHWFWFWVHELMSLPEFGFHYFSDGGSVSSCWDRASRQILLTHTKLRFASAIKEVQQLWLYTSIGESCKKTT